MDADGGSIFNADLHADTKSYQVSESKTAQASDIPSVADEIKKLADLHNSGVLTADEFKEQKARLLGSNRPIA